MPLSFEYRSSHSRPSRYSLLWRKVSGWALPTLIVALLGVAAVAGFVGMQRRRAEAAARTEQIRALWLGSLPAQPIDASNRVSQNPRAAALGAALFHDARLSADGRVSCATCHDPARAFTDGKPVGQGRAQVRRNTPSVVGVAYSSWFFWDGRRDSLWAQALTPLEDEREHAMTRTALVRAVSQHYRQEYESVFGAVGPGALPPLEDTTRFPEHAGPLGDAAAQAAWQLLTAEDRHAVDTVFANVGKCLAAYVSTLRFTASRFDVYAEELLSGQPATALTAEELAGLDVFLGKGQCIVCHAGPLFTTHNFFSDGVPQGAPGADEGRAEGAEAVRADPFNCLGVFSDAQAAQCEELRYLSTKRKETLGAFKVPSLRNVAQTAPYMHAGQVSTLEQVVAHYNQAQPPPPPGHIDIQPLGLSATEQAQLVAFLKTLTSDIADPFKKSVPPSAEVAQ